MSLNLDEFLKQTQFCSENALILLCAPGWESADFEIKLEFDDSGNILLHLDKQAIIAQHLTYCGD